MVKSNNSFEELAAQLERIAKGLEASTAELVKQQTDLNRRIDSLTLNDAGRVVHKAEPAPRQAPEVARLIRKRERLNQRLEAIWQNPDLYEQGAERDIRKSLERVEDDLYAYGHSDSRAHLDTNSAFFARGGTSNFLTASTSTVADVLGIGKNTQQISKAEEDAIEVENCMVL